MMPNPQKTKKAWDPKFQAYARFHGKKSKEQWGEDLETYAKGETDKKKRAEAAMLGYRIWAKKMFDRWMLEQNISENGELSEDDIEDFSKWILTARPIKEDKPKVFIPERRIIT